jgi:hypothetical protein
MNYRLRLGGNVLSLTLPIGSANSSFYMEVKTSLPFFAHSERLVE